MTQKELLNAIKKLGYIVIEKERSIQIKEPFVSRITGEIMLVEIAMTTNCYDVKFLEQVYKSLI